MNFIKRLLEKSACYPLYEAQRGNVIFFILIAIALFAALNFAVSNMLRGGDTQIISEYQLDLISDEILDYTRTVRQAVQSVKISNGCETNTIAFSRTPGDSYEYSGQTELCRIFGGTGGEITSLNPHSDAGDSASWIFSGANTIFDGTDHLVTDDPDLLIFFADINKSLCMALNAKLSQANPSDAPPVDTNGFDTTTLYKGSFSTGGAIAMPGAPSSGCIQNGTNGPYVFYQSLISR